MKETRLRAGCAQISDTPRGLGRLIHVVLVPGAVDARRQEGTERLLALVCRAEGRPGGSSGHGPGAGGGLYAWECKISPLSAAASADSSGVWTTASRQTLWLHETNRHNSITPICLNRPHQAPAVPTDNQLPFPEFLSVLSVSRAHCPYTAKHVPYAVSARNSRPTTSYSTRHSGFLSVAGFTLETGAPLMI